MANGSWTLKECHIDGDFNLRAVVEILPVTLENSVLHLRPERQGENELSGMSRLSNLQHLAIDLGVPFESLDCSTQTVENVIIFKCSLPKLRSLYMCTNPVALFSASVELHRLLPCIEHMAMHVLWTHASPFLMLDSLRCVKMKLHAPQFSLGNDSICDLAVPPTSSLSQLKLIGPEKRVRRIKIDVWKWGIDLKCDNVDGVTSRQFPVLPAADCPFDMALSDL